MNIRSDVMIARIWRSEKGFGLLEVMIAMVILAFSILGVMGMFEWGERGLQEGAKGMRALALAKARIEAKRTVPWNSLLRDDVDFEGVSEITMKDDGIQPDQVAGDGIFIGEVLQEGIRLTWTVQFEGAVTPVRAGSAIIHARACFEINPGRTREINIGTLRANPAYVGARPATRNL